MLQVHQEAHVHHKLAQQGGEDVEAEDAGVGARLAAGSGQRGQGKGSRGGLVAAARLACASTGLRVSTRERIQAGRPQPCHEDCRTPARPPAHLMRSRGCAWLMKKNMPAVSTPARVACRRRREAQALPGSQQTCKAGSSLVFVCACTRSDSTSHPAWRPQPGLHIRQQHPLHTHPSHPRSHCLKTHLHVSQLDSVHVEHAEGVGGGQAQQAQDLEHLDGGHLRAGRRAGKQAGGRAGRRAGSRKHVKYTWQRWRRKAWFW